MKRSVLVIGLGLALAAMCFAEEPDWKTERYDTMFVPPGAEHLTFKNWGYGREQLTYTIEERYPAPNFTGHLCNLMKGAGWTPRNYGFCTDTNPWTKMTGPPRDWYQGVQAWDKWQNNELEEVSYFLMYSYAKEDHYLRTLHVSTECAHKSSVVLPEPPPKPAKAVDPRRDALIRTGALAIYVLVLAGLLWLVTRRGVRSALFYSGPKSWLTGINLFAFSPAAITFLSLSGFFVAAVFPAREGIPGSGALVEAVGVWLILFLCSYIGYVAVPIVFLLAARILAVDEIPGRVKAAHTVLALLTIGYFVMCMVYFSGPLIRW